VGFSLFFFINDHDNAAFGYNEEQGLFLWPLITVLRTGMLGDFDIESYSSMLQLIGFVLCTAFITVLLLNLLIANMGDSYAAVKETERLEGLQQRAHMIVEFEALRLLSRGFKYPCHMHIAVAADTDMEATRWQGVTGTIKKELFAIEQKLNRRVGECEVRIAEKLKEHESVLVEVKEMLVRVAQAMPLPERSSGYDILD